MNASASQAQLRSLSCPACDGPVEVKSRHVAIAGTTVRVFCSADCMRGVRKPVEVIAPPLPAPRRRRRWMWWIAGGIAAAATCVVGLAARTDEDIVAPPAPPMEAPIVAVATATPTVEPDPRIAEDKAWLAELERLRWLHPLSGPTRRMPVNHNGAFGAERPGERPPECVSGHCGVDVGNEWGEPIHAVHDGVIDWVNRGPNEERGGIFVKISHQGGTLFSWYFHLAAVPRWVQPGAKVTAGQVIGLLGDTGVKHSSPHLHFSLSVKPSKNQERYLDPEPLLAIWPLWIRGERNDQGRMSTATEPGVPVRAPAKRKRKPAANDAPVPAAEPPVEPSPEPPAAE